ncbi:MAG: DUF1232 domain-containing protein [Planctomycetes bacterium]|nr:DUF1232 domain-containing protein [Planctomycetota bacterium]
MLAMKHPRTPWYAKGVGALTLLYALAPIDLIPDFIPVIGYLDDFVLVPAGLWVTIKLVPNDVWAECEAEAARRELEKPPKDWRGVILIVFLWIALAVLGYWLIMMSF